MQLPVGNPNIYSQDIQDKAKAISLWEADFQQMFIRFVIVTVLLLFFSLLAYKINQRVKSGAARRRRFKELFGSVKTMAEDEAHRIVAEENLIPR